MGKWSDTASIVNQPAKTNPKYISSKPKGFFVQSGSEFDALTLDGVAVGGNSISLQQKRILHNPGKNIIALPDGDMEGKDS